MLPMGAVECSLTPYRVVTGRGAYTMGTADGVIIVRLHPAPHVLCGDWGQVSVRKGALSFVSLLSAIGQDLDRLGGCMPALIIRRLFLAHGNAAGE